MKHNKLAVIAFGGNALLRGNQKGTIEEQESNTSDTMENILFLIKQGYNLILAHGNGPQVGNILMRNDAGEQNYGIPQMPMDVAVADSQGSIGYMLERALRNVLIKNGIEKEIVTVVTQVVVDKNDPAFNNPTKRVGKIYSKADADKLADEKKWTFKEEVKADGGYRRVVPSPKPLDFLNSKTICQLANEGKIVITVGGGGIPVYYDENNQIRPLEAVIDKDLASAMVAIKSKANEFYILTDVPYVYINYKKENQKTLEHLTHSEALKHLNDGQFAEGSMAPKIRAALNFIEGGGKMSIITEATMLKETNCGTKITM